MTLPLVFITGPFRAATPWGIEQNVRRAEVVALELARHGSIVPVCVHAMYRHYQGSASDDYWLAATMEILHRCDAIYLLPGWAESAGAQAECEEANRLGLPALDDLDQAWTWSRAWRALARPR